MKFSIVHEFDIDPKGYWELFLSKDFNEALMAGLKMKNYKILEQTDDGKTMRRVHSMEPEVAIPAMFQKFVPDLGYTEYDELDHARSSMHVKIVPAAMKDKFSTEGDYIVTPAGEGKCRREFRGETKVSIMLVGGKMEQFTVDEMKKSYETATRITKEWIAKKKA